jgi:hypothetical protein
MPISIPNLLGIPLSWRALSISIDTSKVTKAKWIGVK